MNGEKEKRRICGACMTEFTPRVHNQIYCPDCRKNPRKAYALHVRQQKKYDCMLGGTVNNNSTHVCRHCGRKFVVKTNKLYGEYQGERPEFCSFTCSQAYHSKQLAKEN